MGLHSRKNKAPNFEGPRIKLADGQVVQAPPPPSKIRRRMLRGVFRENKPSTIDKASAFRSRDGRIYVYAMDGSMRRVPVGSELARRIEQSKP